MDIVELLADHHGVMRSSALKAAGAHSEHIAAAVRGGAIRRFGHGVYGLDRARSADVAAVLLRGQVACVSACEAAGLDSWDRVELPHIAVPRARAQSRRPAATRSAAAVHRVPEASPGLTLPPLTVALSQASRCTSPLGQLVLIESALRARRIAPNDVASLTGGTRRRRAWLTSLASALTESAPESAARAALVTAGLDVSEQVWVGGVGRVDFQVEGLLVEVDGWQFHRDRAAFVNDRQRDRALRAVGLDVVRFAASEVRRDPWAVAREVAHLLGREVSPQAEREWQWVARGPARP